MILFPLQALIQGAQAAMDAVGTTTRVRAMMDLVGAMKPKVQAMKARAATATAPSAALIQAAVGIAASVGF